METEGRSTQPTDQQGREGAAKPAVFSGHPHQPGGSVPGSRLGWSELLVALRPSAPRAQSPDLEKRSSEPEQPRRCRSRCRPRPSCRVCKPLEDPGSYVAATRCLTLFSFPSVLQRRQRLSVSRCLTRPTKTTWLRASLPTASQIWLWLCVSTSLAHLWLELLTRYTSPRTTFPTSKTSNATPEAPSRGWPTSSTSSSMGRCESRRLSWRGHAFSCPGRTNCGRWFVPVALFPFVGISWPRR